MTDAKTRMRRTILLTAVLALCVQAGASTAVALAGEPPSPRACLRKDSPGLEKVVVRFNGLRPSENMVLFYQKLKAARALPCYWATLTPALPSVSHQVVTSPHRSMASYKTSMNKVLCSLNPKGCRKGEPVAQNLFLPDVNWNVTFPVWHRIPLTKEDSPDQSLEQLLERNSIVIPETGDRTRADWLETIRKANLDFTRDLTRQTMSAKGNVLQQRVLVVPVYEYSATFDVPSSVLKAAQVWKIENFSMEPATPLKPRVRSNPTVDSFRGSFDSAIGMITLPKTLPPAKRADVYSVVIADRGIDINCAFLKPESDLVAPDQQHLKEKCDNATHGTHVWGIIAGRVPGVMRGIALDGNKGPRIEPYDYETVVSWDLPSFIGSKFAEGARVVNLSIDFQYDLLPKQQKRFQEVVEQLRGVVYIVAAENDEILYSKNSNLPFPIRLHGEQNVVVVTSLDKDGKAIFKQAARNNSRKVGDDIVMIAAPGNAIPSACSGQEVGVLEGTSQATAFVSGAASLLVRDGLEDGRKVKWRLAYTSDVLPDLVEGVTAGRLNVDRALGSDADKWCANSGSNHEGCPEWKSEPVALGYLNGATFVAANRIDLHSFGNDTKGVRPSNLLRVVPNADGTFTVFYLDLDESELFLRRRVRIDRMEAVAEGIGKGPMVVQAASASPDGILDSTELGDLTRRVPDL